MNDLWMATLVGTVSGIIGTAFGGLLACFIPVKNRRVISFVLEFSGGLMLSIVCFDLMPSAFQYASLSPILLAMLGGVGLMVMSECFVQSGKQLTAKHPTLNSSMRSTGLVIALGVAIHNFPEGLAIGSGFEAEISLGLSLALAIMLHDVPEGISIAVPLIAGGAGKRKAFWLTFASGLPMGVGALVGALMGRLSTFFIALCLAAAGGAMLYVIFADMIPESKRTYGGRLGSVGSILGMLCGIIISVQLNV